MGIIDKIKDIYKPREKTEKDKLIKVVEEYRKTIPPIYNNVELLDELCNPELDWYIDISNRSDGKSMNYFRCLCKISIELNLKFIVMCRHYDLRKAYQETLVKAMELDDQFAPHTMLSFKRGNEYTMVYYDDKELCIITELNSASDLKIHSSVLKEFPIIVYDEFLALESDYVSEEFEKLKTIYESVDRNHGNIPYIGIPKIFLLGNAVNFASPLLSNLDLFFKLQNHPMNTKQIYDNITMKISRNDNVNELRNTRAFGGIENDPMSSAQFDFNMFLLLDSNDNLNITKTMCIKHEDKYIEVMELKNGKIVLKVNSIRKPYEFTTELQDLKEGVVFLSERYKKQNMRKKYENEMFHFYDAFSKDYVLKNPHIYEINIFKCLAMLDDVSQSEEMKEKIYLRNNEEVIKKQLFKKFFEYDLLGK